MQDILDYVIDGNTEQPIIQGEDLNNASRQCWPKAYLCRVDEVHAFPSKAHVLLVFQYEDNVG